MSRLNSNRKICTYEDFTVFEGDYRSISSSWLTDTAVNFGSIWLKNDILGKDSKKVSLKVYRNDFSDPSNSETEELLKSVEADPKRWCCFILNDNNDPTVVSGGCHWTLLLHDPIKKVLWQLDPMSDFQPPYCTSIRPCFKHNYKILHCPKMSVNGSCGVYVLEYLHAIFKFLKNGGQDITQVDLSSINDRFATERRLFYCDVLNKLAVEQGRDPIVF